jgi:hypothetical protein
MPLETLSDDGEWLIGADVLKTGGVAKSIGILAIEGPLVLVRAGQVPCEIEGPERVLSFASRKSSPARLCPT